MTTQEPSSRRPRPELTKWNNADYLETLAAAYASFGVFDSAVKWQTKANALREDDDEKVRREARLRCYREAKTAE